jgi:predicted metal-binding protein
VTVSRFNRKTDFATSNAESDCRGPVLSHVGSASHQAETAYMRCMTNNASIMTARSRRAEPVLVCKKCLKRVEDGGSLKKALKSELKHRDFSPAKKPPRVVLTSCFGICPKRAVVVASGTTLQRGEYLLLTNTDQAAEAVALLVPVKGE